MSERIVTAPLAGSGRERTSPERPVHGRPALITRRFAVLLGCQACFGFSFSAFFLLPKFLAGTVGASAVEIGLLTSITSIATVFIMIWMGILVDRVGRKLLIIWGGLLMAASSIAFAWVDTMGPLVYVLRVLQALAFAMTYVAGSAMTVDLAPEERLGEAPSRPTRSHLQSSRNSRRARDGWRVSRLPPRPLWLAACWERACANHAPTPMGKTRCPSPGSR